MFHSGDHCQSIIGIYEERRKSTEEEFESDAETKISVLDTELDSLRSKHRRLLAQREAHYATDLACQRSAVVLDQAGQCLLKATSLTAVAGFLEERVHVLERTPRPQMTRQNRSSGEPPSLCSTIQTLGRIDGVARFSIEENARNHVYDYADGERAIRYVSNALTNLDACLTDVTRPTVSAALSSAFWKVLTHMHAIKNLAEKTAALGGQAGKKQTPNEIEAILRQCQDIIRTKHSRLKEAGDLQAVSADFCAGAELITLRTRQSEAIMSIGSQILDIEALEEQLKTLRDDVHVCQKLRSFGSLLNMMSSQESLIQPTANYQTLFPLALRPAVSIHDLELHSSNELDNLAERVRSCDPDARLASMDNGTVLAYLATLERSVDTSKLTTLSLAPNSVTEILLEDHNSLLKSDSPANGLRLK